MNIINTEYFLKYNYTLMNYYKRMTKVNIRDNVINNKKYDINKYENDGFEWYTAMKDRDTNNNEENYNIKKNEENNKK